MSGPATRYHAWVPQRVNETSTVKILLKKKIVCGHSYCRYTVFKQAPAYQLLHSSINDKNAVQAKHIRKVGIPVLLHRTVIKFLKIKSESWTERKNMTAVLASSVQKKLVRFKKERFRFFCNRQRQTQRTRKV